jgi:hypothetical protein
MLLSRAKTASKFMVCLSKYKGAKFNMKKIRPIKSTSGFRWLFLILLGGHEKVQAALVGGIKLRARVFIVAVGGFIFAKNCRNKAIKSSLHLNSVSKKQHKMRYQRKLYYFCNI